MQTTSTPDQIPLPPAQSPVPLSTNQLAKVSGAGPNGNWQCGPNGNWQ